MPSHEHQVLHALSSQGTTADALERVSWRHRTEQSLLTWGQEERGVHTCQELRMRVEGHQGVGVVEAAVNDVVATCVWRIRIYRIDAATIQVLRRWLGSLDV